MHQPHEEEVGRVLVLKLANGETVVGTVAKESQGYIELSNPFRLVMIPNGSTMSLTILRWDMTIDFDYPVRVFKSTIVACGKPNDHMLTTYTEVVTHGFDTNETEDEVESSDQEAEDRLKEMVKNSKVNKLH